MSVSIVPSERTVPPQVTRMHFVDPGRRKNGRGAIRNILLEVSPREILCYHWRLMCFDCKPGTYGQVSEAMNAQSVMGDLL